MIISRDHRGPAPEGGLAGWATWGRDLAAATGLHRNTITNIEVGRYASDSATLTLIKDVFMREGVDFIDENGGGAGVRLRKSPSRWYRLRQGVRRTEKLKRLSYIQTMGDREPALHVTVAFGPIETEIGVELLEIWTTIDFRAIVHRR